MGLQATFQLASRFLEKGLAPTLGHEGRVLRNFVHGSAISKHPYRDILQPSVRELHKTKGLTWRQALATRFDVVLEGWCAKMALWLHTRELTKTLANNTEFLQAWRVKTQETVKKAINTIERLSPEKLLELCQTGGLDRWKSVLSSL